MKLLLLCLFLILIIKRREPFINKFKIERIDQGGSTEVIENNFLENPQLITGILKEAGQNNYKYSYTKPPITTTDSEGNTSTSREQKIIIQETNSSGDKLVEPQHHCCISSNCPIEKKTWRDSWLKAGNQSSLIGNCGKCCQQCKSSIDFIDDDINKEQLNEDIQPQEYNDASNRENACTASCNINDDGTSRTEAYNSFVLNNLNAENDIMNKYQVSERVESIYPYTGVETDMVEKQNWKKRLHPIKMKLARNIMASIGCHRLRGRHDESNKCYDYGYYDVNNKICQYGFLPKEEREETKQIIPSTEMICSCIPK